ncbi:MAG: hypothetical protein ACRCU3_09310 [Eubacteriaceae bacterium]
MKKRKDRVLILALSLLLIFGIFYPASAKENNTLTNEELNSSLIEDQECIEKIWIDDVNGNGYYMKAKNLTMTVAEVENLVKTEALEAEVGERAFVSIKRVIENVVQDEMWQSNFGDVDVTHVRAVENELGYVVLLRLHANTLCAHVMESKVYVKAEEPNPEPEPDPESPQPDPEPLQPGPIKESGGEVQFQSDETVKESQREDSGWWGNEQTSQAKITSENPSVKPVEKIPSKTEVKTKVDDVVRENTSNPLLFHYIGTIGLSSIASIGLGASIIKDLKILRWVKKKKELRIKKGRK